MMPGHHHANSGGLDCSSWLVLIQHPTTCSLLIHHIESLSTRNHLESCLPMSGGPSITVVGGLQYSPKQVSSASSSRHLSLSQILFLVHLIPCPYTMRSNHSPLCLTLFNCCNRAPAPWGHKRQGSIPQHTTWSHYESRAPSCNIYESPLFQALCESYANLMLSYGWPGREGMTTRGPGRAHTNCSQIEESWRQQNPRDAYPPWHKPPCLEKQRTNSYTVYLFTYLKGRAMKRWIEREEREGRARDSLSICWFVLQTSATLRAGPGPSQGTTYASPKGVAGTPRLQPSLLP